MTYSKKSFFIVVSMIAVLSGCSTSRFENKEIGNTQKVFYPVMTYDLSSSEDSSPSFSEREEIRNDTQMVNLELSSNAVDLFPASVAGVWNLSIGGRGCRIATPQTKFGQGYRAGPLHCPGIFSRVKSWNIKGKRLYFYDGAGRAVAAFYSNSMGRFEGLTFDNQSVVLNR
ncbi:AprI/Inh family metalloprotease inhibitor [Bartonella sp. F02]|uniref:AprI/Inh family metalloprotease inhibitor n=1 Tax=Bartonella sp. F02 TaxID=2967262 RepID=UPI0022A9F42D|nr:AprI/Inh family metalloprotease inhibitor [Bartonella sp. F02]MCZ2327917.1 protease inhibitor Inh/omp19 family protein [Bartonella sp. F02]